MTYRARSWLLACLLMLVPMGASQAADYEEVALLREEIRIKDARMAILELSRLGMVTRPSHPRLPRRAMRPTATAQVLYPQAGRSFREGQVKGLQLVRSLYATETAGLPHRSRAMLLRAMASIGRWRRIG